MDSKTAKSLVLGIIYTLDDDWRFGAFWDKLDEDERVALINHLAEQVGENYVYLKERE